MDRFNGFMAVILAAMLACSTTSYADELIYYRDWVKVKKATSVLQLPALQRVVSQFETNEKSKIVVQYPGGDEGNEWAIELRNWFVALGISSDEILLQPGSGVPQAIVIKTEVSGLP